MPYPFWDAGIGYGPLMAFFAVIHVFVSHFAIGGGLYLVVAERSARKANDTERLDFVRRLSKFFVLLTIVFGALSGVGIWFIIGLLNPNATEMLIHNFVWGWAIEWTFFVIEILAAILYYYGWKKMSARDHLVIGWIYFGAAWLSLVIINGIITFMLTPGAWIETGAFWDGFFNPTYWPSLVFRTGICLVLAGLFALLVASRLRVGDFKARLVRYNATWAIVGFVVVAACWFWYLAAIPEGTREVALDRLSIPAASLGVMFVATAAVAAAVVLVGVAAPRFYVLPVGILVLLLALVAFGGFEWFREAARKPYVTTGYMYGNGMRVDAVDAWRKDGGLLEQVAFRTGDDDEHAGADLFRMACQTCHQQHGYNAVMPVYDHTDLAYIEGSLAGLQEMRRKMPPFPGNDEERKLLATWIWNRVDQRPLAEATGLEGVALGKAVYEKRCASCHVPGGWKDPSDTLNSLDGETIGELISEEMADAMPIWSGPENEKQALIEYILTWRKGGAE